VSVVKVSVVSRCNQGRNRNRKKSVINMADAESPETIH
jgi:hypothetical protein